MGEKDGYNEYDGFLVVVLMGWGVVGVVMVDDYVKGGDFEMIKIAVDLLF